MDYEEGSIDLNRELVASPLSTVLMRVQGEAMGGDGLRDGDLVVIDRALDPRPGCLVVALWEGHFIVRRLSRPDPRRRPRLEASDGVSVPIALDVGQGSGARLWGVVRLAVHRLVSTSSAHPVWCWHNLRPPAAEVRTPADEKRGPADRGAATHAETARPDHRRARRDAGERTEPGHGQEEAG